MDDTEALMRLHVELHRWDEAFDLARQQPVAQQENIYLPYAEWLALNDRFEEAQAVCRMSHNMVE